ncbi:MAG: phosphoribosyl-AMP cyclohydrolase, partial [Candidatus Bathyarchaeota archaeon]
MKLTEIEAQRLAESLNYEFHGLIQAIVQDIATNEVLMVAYMNKEAVRRTLTTGIAHFWSRSRNRLWLKGETSGHFQDVKEILVDCDEDVLL